MIKKILFQTILEMLELMINIKEFLQIENQSSIKFNIFTKSHFHKDLNNFHMSMLALHSKEEDVKECNILAHIKLYEKIIFILK